jgi:hypothetical protein
MGTENDSNKALRYACFDILIPVLSRNLVVYHRQQRHLVHIFDVSSVISQYECGFLCKTYKTDNVLIQSYDVHLQL